MASVIVCDKCGMSCGEVTKFMHIRAHKLVNTENFKNSAEKYMDVCTECYKKIFNNKKEDEE